MAGMLGFLCLVCQTSNCVLHRGVRMNSPVVVACHICGKIQNLFRCSKCKFTHYCGSEHQKIDWKRHKPECKRIVRERSESSSVQSARDSEVSHRGSNSGNNINVSGEPASGSSSQVSTYEYYSPGASTSRGDDSTYPVDGNNMPMDGHGDPLAERHPYYAFPELNFFGAGCPPSPYCRWSERMTDPEEADRVCRNVIRDMDTYGVCVLDDFIGSEQGGRVLQEVLEMYSAGVFADGQLVTNTQRRDLIRGDRITWLDGTEPNCSNIGMLIQEVDNIIFRASRMIDNGKIGAHAINGRTKAMVACYPGSGSHYVKHVDNPNKDGRLITAIYYLNQDWETSNGGLLRIFPDGWQEQVADIKPIFDRVLFFWSDRRNPHEVQPAFSTRYAITLWYYDSDEFMEHRRRYPNQIHPELRELGSGNRMYFNRV